MFSQIYFYCYVVASVSTFALADTMKSINPTNQSVIPLMGLIGLLVKVANFIFLALCLFYSEHWWYALAMWGIGFIVSILLPPTKFLGYLSVAVAPLCVLLAYLNLFGVI
jgi:hypothetical protein